MLTSEYQAWASARNAKFPTRPQLTLTFNATEIWLATPLLKYYMESGMLISKVYSAVEYTAQEPFRPFIDSMVKQRIAATETGNKMAQQISKLLMNSSWGRLCKYKFSLRTYDLKFIQF